MSVDNNIVDNGATRGFQYDAYGTTIRTGDGSDEDDASDFAWHCLHQCLQQDEEASALHRFRCRERSPLFGRWLQHAPLAHVIGLSLYEYMQPRR